MCRLPLSSSTGGAKGTTMDKELLVMDDRCRGRVLVLGATDDCTEIIVALKLLSRVTGITLVEEDWQRVRRYHDDSQIELSVEDYDDFLMPPVDPHDCAIIMDSESRLKDFVASTVPLIYAIANRGWVPRADYIFVEHLPLMREALHLHLSEAAFEIVKDESYLNHLATNPAKGDLATLCKPFFQFVYHKAQIIGFERVTDLMVLGWALAYSETAFNPGGLDKFKDYVEIV